MDPARFIGKVFSRCGIRTSSSTPENPKQRLGKEGERLAERYLRARHCRILYRNFRAPHGGEVDLVCRDKKASALIFVEVKTRSSLAFGAPAEAVGASKERLITRGALAWLRMLENPEILFRFDIVEVLMNPKRPEIHWIQDAFHLPEPFRY